MTEFFEGYLFGKSTQYSQGQSIREKFHLFIFTVGWEERCTKITDFDSKDFSFDKGVILSFKQDEKKGWKNKYCNHMRKFIKTTKKVKPDFCILCSLVPDDPKSCNINQLLTLIKEEYYRLKQPLKIGFDISSCPRVVFLQVLRYCIENDFTSSLAFFYSEGDYGPFIDSEDIFSSGDWETKNIPGYAGKNIDLKRKDYFIVSFGFEKKSYIGWIDECDSLSRVGVLFPYPGYKPEYDESGKKKLLEFKKDLFLDKVNNTKYFYQTAKAGDAILAWKKIESLVKSNEDYTITFLPYGPKPHSLAMGLSCLLNDNFVLTYRTSSRGYKDFDVKPLGKLWQYEIRNLALY